jgi:hypothetical protein
MLTWVTEGVALPPQSKGLSSFTTVLGDVGASLVENKAGLMTQDVFAGVIIPLVPSGVPCAKR